MKTLIDADSLQAYYHVREMHRLAVFISQLCLHGYSVDVLSLDDSFADGLPEEDVLIIPTRVKEFAPLSDHLLTGIEQFVSAGGGLFLMSNHGPEFVEEDAAIADMFGVTIENTFMSRLRIPTILSDDLLNEDHPIISGASTGNPVRTIVTNTSCSLKSDVAVPLANLSDEMKDGLNEDQRPNEDQYFGVALDQAEVSSKNGEGRVVVLADSGFIGSDVTRVPGPGQITIGDNVSFVVNILHWLGGNSEHNSS